MTPEPKASELASSQLANAPEPKRVSIAIVSLNRAESLRRSLELLGDAHHIVVVDNGSQDGSAAVGDPYPGVRVMRLPKKFGLTKALKIGLRAAESEYLLCLLDDTLISGAAVKQLADYLETHPEVGAVCPLLMDAQGNPAPQVQALPASAEPQPALKAATGGDEITAECVSGAAIMFRGFFLRAIRQIDECYGDYGSNIEVCAQMKRAGKKIVILRNVTAVHGDKPSSMSASDLEGDRAAATAAFLSKHHGFMAGAMYRLKAGLGGLLRFQFAVAGGAFSGTKIDGTS